MARNEIRSKALTEVQVDGRNADQVLSELKTKADSYTRAMVEAQKANDKIAYDKASKSAKEYNQAIKSVERSTKDVTAVLKNLSGATMKELQAAQRKITSDLNGMTRGTTQYIAKSKQLQLVTGEIRKVRTEMNGAAGASQGFFGKMANGFNKYFGLIAGGLAALTGLSLGFRKLSEDAMEFESRVANLSALTGLEGGALDWLAQKAKDLSVGVTDDGVRITKSANDIVDAFTLMGSAKPELLKNKEALALVTIEALKLAEAAKMDTKTAVESLANVMNQFGAGADEASKYINVLAAGSKEGAAAVDSIAASVIKFGPAAASANISVEESVGLVETLAEKGVKGEIAGTQLRTALLKLQTGADQFNPKVVGLTQALENLNNANLSAGDLVKMFGQEAYLAGTIIINNKDQVEKYTKAVTGTNVATEQAIKNTETMAAKLEQSRNRTKLASLELGQRLGGALLFSTNMVRKFIKAIIEVDNVFTRWRKGYPQSFSDAAIKIQEEQRSVNDLVMKLTDANTKEGERRKIIKQLNDISPTLVKNLNAENLSLEQLKINLTAYNEEASNRIILSNLQVEEEKELAKLADQRMRVAKFQSAILQDILSSNQDIALSEDDFAGKTKRTIEYLKEQIAIQERMGVAGKEIVLASGDLVDSRTKEQKLLRNILFLQSTMTKEQLKLKDISDKSISYQERVNALKEILGLNKQINLTGSVDPLDDPAGDPEDTYKTFLASLENYYREARLVTHQHYYEGVITKEEFDSQLQVLELAHLESMLALQKRFGEETYDTQFKITQERIKLMESVRDANKRILDEMIKDNQVNSDKIIEDNFKATADSLDAIFDEYEADDKKKAKLEADALERFKKTAEQYNDIALDIGSSLGQLMGEMAVDAELTAEQFGKNLLVFALDTLQGMMRIYMTQAGMKNIATYGLIGGAAVTALQVAAMETLFTAAKAVLSQRATGKYDVIGAEDGRTYRNVPYGGTPKTGLVTTPTIYGERGDELVVDNRTLRNLRINFPTVLPAIRAAMVPQRASGNVGEYMAKQSSNQSINQSDPELKAILAQATSVIAGLREEIASGVKMSYKEFKKQVGKAESIESSTNRGS